MFVTYRAFFTGDTPSTGLANGRFSALPPCGSTSGTPCFGDPWGGPEVVDVMEGVRGVYTSSGTNLTEHVYIITNNC